MTLDLNRDRRKEPLAALKRSLFFLAVLAPFTFATTARAAGFDCAKARASDEIAICGNSGLSELDTEMSALWYSYSRVPMAMGSNGSRRDEAEAFLTARGACGADVACLRPLYQARIRALKDQIDQWMTAAAKAQN
ncbi:hypothetical protein PY365_09115 [Roseiarcaceae bacterium H3SJ34-1]|uniref:lysozyme inhibitor LprI family protein n=1 Tax=Terripilifer ovatus TaxID=3032367 RepID=UPI003AB932C4|nr:hypothetical protein [Roseiarcaceae bacterium H3SJ34-1]